MNGGANTDHPKLDEQFGCVPASWLQRIRTHRDLAVAVAIISHHNPRKPEACYPSVGRLAEMTRIDRRHVFRALKKLEQDGLFRVERVAGETNRYVPLYGSTPTQTCSDAGCEPMATSATQTYQVTDHIAETSVSAPAAAPAEKPKTTRHATTVTNLANAEQRTIISEVKARIWTELEAGFAAQGERLPFGKAEWGRMHANRPLLSLVERGIPADAIVTAWRDKSSRMGSPLYRMQFVVDHIAKTGADRVKARTAPPPANTTSRSAESTVRLDASW
jgi:predicted transcriptional regulator